MDMKLNFKQIQKIPKNARIQNLIKDGNAKFIDIEVKKNLFEKSSNQSIQVISNDTSKKVAFLVPKKGYEFLYNCFDFSNSPLKNVFVCDICHDTFKNSGGNAARHALQHSKTINLEIQVLLKRIRLFMYKTAQPFSLIEDETFRNLFNVNLPSLKKFHKHMNEDFELLIKEIQLNIDKSCQICLTLDEWSYFNNSFLGITAFLSGKDVVYDSIVLALSIPNEYDRTANTISQELTDQISKFKIKEKLIGAITDCASVMKKSINLMGMTWLPCLSHIIHNTVKKMLDDCPEFSTAMAHANELSNDYRFRQYLSSHLKRKRNIQSFNDTRWLTRSKTCNDIVNLFTIMKQFETTMNKLIKIRNEENSQKIGDYICPITNEDYQICLTLNPTLQRLKKLILKFEKRSHDGYFWALKRIIKCSEFIKGELTTNGLRSIYEKYESYLVKKIQKHKKLGELLSIGSLLNPNLDIEDLVDNESPFYFLINIGKSSIYSKLNKTQKSTIENDQITHKKGKRTKKINLNEYDAWYSIVEPIESNDDERIYNYWLDQTTFPSLQEIALSICAFPTSSSDCERLFSVAKYILGLNRSNMSNHNMEMAVMLYSNYEIAKDAILQRDPQVI